MNRIGFLLKVKAERIEEYKQHHVNVWPEMRAALSRSGWHNYSLFMRPDGLLFGYVETPGAFDEALAKMAKEEINVKWQDFMAPFFEGVPGLHADQQMQVLEQVFFLE